MSALDQVVSVSFHVPTRIADGLRSGEFERIGGVIRQVVRPGNPKAGQVVAWLRESPPLVELMNQARTPGASLPAEVVNQLKAVQVGIGAVAGLQALTLGVTAVGFAVVSAQIRAVDRKLNLVLDRLEHVQSDLDWMMRRADTELLGTVAAAVENARLAEAAFPNDRAVAEFLHSRRELLAARVQLAALADLFVASDKFWDRPQMLQEYSHLYYSTLTAEIRTSLLLGLYDASRETAIAGGATAMNLVNGYQARIPSPLAAIQAAQAVDLEASELLGQGRAILEDTADRCQGYEGEILFLRDSGIDVRDWETLSADVASPTLICIEPIAA